MPPTLVTPCSGLTQQLSPGLDCSPISSLFTSLPSLAPSLIWASSFMRPSLLYPSTLLTDHLLYGGLSRPPSLYLEHWRLLCILHHAISPSRPETPEGPGHVFTGFASLEPNVVVSQMGILWMKSLRQALMCTWYFKFYYF